MPNNDQYDIATPLCFCTLVVSWRYVVGIQSILLAHLGLLGGLYFAKLAALSLLTGTKSTWAFSCYELPFRPPWRAVREPWIALANILRVCTMIPVLPWQNGAPLSACSQRSETNVRDLLAPELQNAICTQSPPSTAPQILQRIRNQRVLVHVPSKSALSLHDQLGIVISRCGNTFHRTPSLFSPCSSFSFFLFFTLVCQLITLSFHPCWPSRHGHHVDPFSSSRGRLSC